MGRGISQSTSLQNWFKPCLSGTYYMHLRVKEIYFCDFLVERFKFMCFKLLYRIYRQLLLTLFSVDYDPLN